MKIFHLSDLHIGLKLMQRDLLDEQRYILAEITEMARREEPDAVLIAGDIYDKAIPPAEAVEVVDNFVAGLIDTLPRAEIMLISGNHDSPQRVNFFRTILAKQHVRMIGLPPRTPEEHIEKVTLTDSFGVVNFYLLPFVKPSMVRAVVANDDDESALSYDETLHRLLAREEINERERNILVSHQFYLPPGKNAADMERMDSEIVTVGNIDAVKSDLLKKFDYAALGHIHKPMLVGGENWRYSGTPMAVSVSEAGQKKGVVSVELKEKGNIRIEVLPLTPRRAVRVIRGEASTVLSAPSEDYVSVVLTDTELTDVIDVQDRLRHAFPNLLEIRRELREKQIVNYGDDTLPTTDVYKDPLALCTDFLGDMDDEDKILLQDVINSLREVQ